MFILLKKKQSETPIASSCAYTSEAKRLAEKLAKRGQAVITTDGKYIPYEGVKDIEGTEHQAAPDVEYVTSPEGWDEKLLAMNVTIGEDGTCSSAGGVLVQPMPNCPEHILVVVEDIVSNFANIGEVLRVKEPSDILKDYFGHFQIEYFPPTKPEYRCKCSVEQMANAVITLGRADSVNLLMERGEIEITCHFCGKKYVFGKQDVIDIWRRYDHKL